MVWPDMDIASWLRSLGLEAYEAAFRENAIDAEILPKLTAEGLKDLGVNQVGHRRKLLSAIEELQATSRVDEASFLSDNALGPELASSGGPKRERRNGAI